MFRFLIYCGTLVLFMILPGCSSVKAEKNTPDFPQSQMSSLDPMRAAMLQKRAEAFTQAMVRSFKSNDFSHWKAFLEKESTPGRPLIVQEKGFKDSVLKKTGELLSTAIISDLWTRVSSGIIYGNVPLRQ